MDIILIGTLIDSFYSGYQAGVLFNNLIYNSPHLKEYNNAVTIIKDIDFKTELSSTDIFIIQKAIAYLNLIDEEDKIYIQCRALYIKSILYVVQYDFKNSIKCLDKIGNISTDGFLDAIYKVKIKEIKYIKNEKVPMLRSEINLIEQAWKKEQMKAHKEKRQVPLWVGILIGILISIVVLLINHIIHFI